MTLMLGVFYPPLSGAVDYVELNEGSSVAVPSAGRPPAARSSPPRDPTVPGPITSTKRLGTAAGVNDPDCKSCSGRPDANRAVVRAAIAGNSRNSPFPDPKKTYNVGYPRQNKIQTMHATCGPIMDANWAPQEVGIALVDAMKKYSEKFTENKSLAKICRGFPGMDSDQKLKAWVWFFTVMANKEHGCAHNLPDKGGFGYWNANYPESIRRAKGPDCIGRIEDVHVQVTCVVKTVEIMLRANRGLLVPDGDQYFGSLYSSLVQSQIVPKMKMYPGC